MGDNGENKRRHKRHIVDGIFGNLLYSTEVNVVNLSIDGAAIETTKRLELNREYPFKIRYKGTLLNLKGLVVWSVLSQSKKKDSGEVIPLYKAGLKFTELLDEKTKILLKFIEDSKVKSTEKRLSGIRVKIAESKNKNIKIDFPYRYDVKKISLSGMLVAIEHPLELNARHHMELFLNKDVLNIVGRIAYCDKNTSNEDTKYDIGIEFVDMSDNDKVLLKEFIDTLEE
ncbi:MAG: PilZ domain-containing protein [Nitrospira sp.]|nr:PilZ domain-containing protein [Nitrospira sp.]